MKKRLNVFWWKLHEANGNFGDELNQYIISKLTGCKINRIIIPRSGLEYLNIAMRQFYNRQIQFNKIPLLIKQFFINDFIVGIGSVISQVNSKSCKIWGTGIMSKSDIINPAIFFAVRGKYTQARLKELNLPVPETIGDPALLLPIIYKAKTFKKYKIGIIPHFMHYEELKDKVKDSTIIVINLTSQIEKIIDQINSCEFTISTSLHGLIVSHSYNIPSLWFKSSQKSLPGDKIKFYDYFSSVGIEEYKPFLVPRELTSENLLKIFYKYSRISRINMPLREIQGKLIKKAPFSVLEQYTP